AYGVDRVRAIVESVFAELRSRGQRVAMLPAGSLAGRLEALDAEGARACALAGELLERFGRRYEALKRGRGAVDFDDLELGARELLEERQSVRSAWSERFALLMVDEFQDTNPQQLAILSALERGNLFTVGDELQSIYSFRHAEVGLFRARRAQLAERGATRELRGNFRSRPQLVDAVNAVFSARMGASYTPLVAARGSGTGADAAGNGRAGDARGRGASGEEPLVELLLTDRRG